MTRSVLFDLFRILAVALLVAAPGCVDREDGHGHGHDHGHGQAEEEEAPPLSFTRWTDRYELFVELPAPAPGKPVPYHAHVTRLSDFHAVTEGTFTVRYKSAGSVVAEHVQTGVKRPGIFVYEGPAPLAGAYALEMVYQHEGETDVFDCGSITVADDPPPQKEAPGSTITFLKESQWKIPFRTAWSEERPLAREMELAATVEPAGKDQLTVGAPTGGRFFHNPKIALAEGLRIHKGDILGTIAPTASGDDFSRLQLAVEEARLAKEQTLREIERVEALVKQGLLPERRLTELRNELETQTARLRSAGGRLGRVTASGGEGGLTIRSTLEGLVSQVLVPNGEPVDAGASLVRLGGTEHLWIRARFIAKPASLFVDPAPVALRLASGDRVDLEALGARFLSSLPVVDTTSRIATWIVDIPPPVVDSADQGKAKAPVDLRAGGNVVLLVRFGEPETLSALPREAVVEINTRPMVFVQVDGEHFEKRAVSVGRADGDFIHVISGVDKGERVVTQGGFDIHLAALMGTIESHRH